MMYNHENYLKFVISFHTYESRHQIVCNTMQFFIIAAVMCFCEAPDTPIPQSNLQHMLLHETGRHMNFIHKSDHRLWFQGFFQINK